MHAVTARHASLRPYLWSLVLAAALLVASAFYLVVAHLPAAKACTPNTPGCVVVSTSAPGSAPTSGNGGGGGHGGRGSTSLGPCAGLSGYAYVACRTLAGSGAVRYPACVQMYDRNYPSLTTAQLDALLTANGCPVVPRGLALPSPAQLAQRAAASFQLPLPSGHRSPSESLLFHGYPFAYINTWVYFYTDPATWRALTATARAGGNWATVTARPVSLGFAPGDGHAAVQCAGPGEPWTAVDGLNPPPAGACGYEYQQVTGPGFDHPYTSRQTITWRLTWTGSGNTSGTLTQRSTSRVGQLNVFQIQSVVTR